LKSTLYNLTEMLHFEISAVELRASMHKVDAQLAMQPEGVLQGVVNKLAEMLHLPTACTWAEGGLPASY
jgi:hypothetical protein